MIIDTDVSAIIEEELLAMFADEITPKEAADFIQSRVALIISERN